MKRSILLLASILMTGALLTNCSTPEQKVEHAQENVREANAELDKANQNYKIDMENYRKETRDQIAENDKSIAEFKERIKHYKKEAKAEYEKQIDLLQKKNREMKLRLEDYKAEGQDKWETFKAEFGKSMDELGKSIKDLTSKHTADHKS